MSGAVPGTQSHKLLSGKVLGICRMGKFEKLVGLRGEKNYRFCTYSSTSVVTDKILQYDVI